MPTEALTPQLVEPPSGPRPSPIRPRWAARRRLSSADWLRLQATLRPLLLLIAGSWALHRGDALPAHVITATERKVAFVEALRTRGLLSEPHNVHFVSARQPLLRTPIARERALVLAARRGEPNDVYLVETRRSSEGHLLRLSALYNLTDTSAADEQKLVVADDRAAWVILQEGAFTSLQSADLRGERPPSGEEWSRFPRLQNAVTNYQETGQLEGIGRRSFKLEPPAYRVVLGLSAATLIADADAHKIVIPLNGATAAEGERWIRDQTRQKARPGNLVTWAVDRVRALTWFGDDSIEYVKAVAFEGVDQFEQIVGTVTGNDGSAAVAEELGKLYSAPVAEATDSETGWPPPPMEPMLKAPLKGEGKWVGLASDPFVARNAGAPTPFVVSFIRTDRKRAYSQVFVTLWDPRQVELNTMSGTVEPRSATGETGPGMVPRDPRVLSRFVGAFNGGFQAVHGEFGLMAERVLYLPPKPFAATVAKLANGSTGFGTWPEDASVPDKVISYRQNMTPLIVDENVNPYKRHWWGGVPPGWTEESRTVRSGVCMTREGFVGYFYGASLDPDVLALAMQRARCSYGIHLDMNAGHTGLEFYRVGPKGTLPKVNRALEPLWEAQGPVPGMPGWEFLSRRMIKYMALMNFPRYVHTESRDFFYLTLRHLLPGDPAPTTIAPAEEGEGAWRTHALPQHGWPHAVATTNVRPDATRPFARVGLIKLDPKFLRVERTDENAAQRIIEFRAVLNEGPSALWHSETRGFVIARVAPEPAAVRITAGIPSGSPDALRAQAALGIDAGGMLLYARVTEGPEPGKDGALLLALLGRLGCQNSLLLPRPLGAVLSDGADAPGAKSADRIVFVRGVGPGAERIFGDTPIVPPKHWAPLQQKRVRYK
ncbi:MAG TPA: hypothetical protein VER33_23385 [Polyangiaceae bacterium]|nr:hypothetical protein [Polyangiaceae bacterium]